MSEIRTDTINNASGDNDSGIDLSTNDQVDIKTANTTALTVNASQNVGIGETSPLGKLHVKSGDSGASVSVHGDELVVEGSANSGISILSGNSNAGVIYFGDDGDNNVAEISYDHSANAMKFFTNASEAMRITADNNFLVGKTASDNSTVGTRFQSDGFGSLVRDGNKCLVLNRKTSNGQIIDLQKDGNTVGSIGGSQSVTGPFIGHINVGLTMYHVGNAVLPATTGGLRDNAIDLGNSSNRFDDVFATNSSIQTSDRNEKQDIEELSEAEQRVAVVAKGLMRKYRWRDAVAEKGENARTHFGIIAQDLQDAFTAEGLDASDYAMFCSDTWWEKEISVDAVEADEENGIEAKDAYTYRKIAEEATEGYTEKTRLGVRYSELLAFIISAI